MAVALGALAGLRLLRIANDLKHARTLIETAGPKIENGDIAGARADLQDAQKLLVSSNSSLYNHPEIDAIAWLPVIHENVDALRDTVSLALELVSGGNRILTVAQPLEDTNGRLEVPLKSGAIPLATVHALQGEVTALAQALPGSSERPSSARLVGSVRDAQTKVFNEAVRRRAQLGAVARGLTLLNEMAGGNGDRRFLIAVANTAEMRGTGGMILSYGVLEGANGDFALPAFGKIDELFLDKPVDPSLLTVPADEATRWSGLEPDRLWRNANLMPDLSVAGPRLAAMYQSATGLPVDGVIQIDAEGLAAILKGIGPVDVEGIGQVTADNVVDLTLNQAYTLFPNRDQRQEVLGDVAEVVFRRLVDGEYSSLRPLGEALLKSANERHVELWSPNVSASQPASFFKADGAIPSPTAGDSLLFTVQNFGHNKLDYYVDTSVSVSGSHVAGQVGTATVQVTIANTAPAGVLTPEYVFGDGNGGVERGTYFGVASIYVPDGTSLKSSDAEGAALTTEDGRGVIGWQVRLAGATSQTFTFQIQLAPRPPGPYTFALAPLPRVRPTVWNVDMDAGNGVRAQFSGPLEVATTVAGTPRS